MGTLSKGLSIIETLQKNKGDLGLNEIVDKTGLSLGTASRIVTELVKRGYLYQQERHGKYSLGIRLMQFQDVENYVTTLNKIAMPYLKALSNQVCETSAIVVLNSLEGIDVAINFHPRSLIVNRDIFGHSPLHCTSVGKILLAYMDEKKINAVISQGLKSYTKKTIINPKQLVREIEEVRKNNIAFDIEEYALNICSIAAPIMMRDGKVISAVCIVAPTFRINPENLINLTPIIQEYAIKISSSLYEKEKK